MSPFTLLLRSIQTKMKDHLIEQSVICTRFNSQIDFVIYKTVDSMSLSED